MSYFSKNIKYLRTEQNLNQDEFEDTLNIKKTTFSNYEVGRSEPKLDSLIQISKFFGVSLDDFLTKDLENESFAINKTQKEVPILESEQHEIKCQVRNCDFMSMIEKKDQKLLEMSEEVGRLKQEIATLKKGTEIPTYRRASEP